MSSDTPPGPRQVPPSAALARMRRHTAARIALGRVGAGQPTSALLQFALDHAKARDAIRSDLAIADLTIRLASGPWPVHVGSAAGTRDIYLTRPDLGRALSPEGQVTLAGAARCDLAVVVADGLSAQAVNMHAPPVLSALRPLLPAETEVGIVLVTQGRVAIGDRIAAALGATAVLVLIGERPGLSASDSMGAYLTWTPTAETTDANRFCVSNIRSGGLAPDSAAAQLAALLQRCRIAGHSGLNTARIAPR